MLLFGPGDFSHLIGKPGQMSAPEVVAARKRVGAAGKKHGKFVMASGLMAPPSGTRSGGLPHVRARSGRAGAGGVLQGKANSF